MNLLRNNPIFWSKLGFSYDPPILDDNADPFSEYSDYTVQSRYHKQFADAGVVLHSSIIHSGWVGVDKFDYSLTNKTLEELFTQNENILYIPRVKLNVPIDWTAQNPEDVFVYYGGPKTKEKIAALVGSEKQDYFGYNAASAYYNDNGKIATKGNTDGVISLQSFSSKKWLFDAGVALKKFVQHLENSKYADKIAGYHIAFGICGESMLWGRMTEKCGDYGINNAKEFFDWGIKKYGCLENLRTAWHNPQLTRSNCCVPPPDMREVKTLDIIEFFRGNSQQNICIDYDLFMSDVNVNAIEYFAKIAKKYSGGKPIGAFYGYFIHITRSAYTGHLGLSKLLNCPYIDFLCSPKPYYRLLPGEPCCEMCPSMSVNRKKLWIEETDHRTHLYSGNEPYYKIHTMSETRTLLAREFAKNISHNSGFWWMDLGGGWYDSEEIMSEIKLLTNTNSAIRTKPHISQSEVLAVVDDDCINYMNISNDLRLGFVEDFLCEIHTCGTIIDTYRLCDLPELDLKQYKFIAFLNTFKMQDSFWNTIKSKIEPGTHILWNYAAGIRNNQVDIKNTAKLTGINVSVTSDNTFDFPMIKIDDDNAFEILPQKIAKTTLDNGVISILNTIPYLKNTKLRELMEMADCHFYAPLNCTVYGDNRLLGVFNLSPIKDSFNLKHKSSFTELFSGTNYNATKQIPLNMNEKSAKIFIVKSDDNEISK